MSKKIYSIYPRTKQAAIRGLATEKGGIEFKGRSVINTSNEKLAKEIEERYGQKRGGEAFVVHDEQLSRAKDSGTWDIVKKRGGGVAVKTTHRYFFGGSPSQSYDENYERIFGHK